ncbi:other/FunK1 protein kinase [Coprinopsis cinerea AmutBmut pab1-1]|nr:other/FunK1 protein kinase [Coprinopsis cinerea AmutBmut pab1-1]
MRIPGEPDVILKDAFLDRHTPTEADIQERLFEDIAAFSRNKDWRKQSILKDFPSDDLECLAEALTGEVYKKYFSCITAKYLGPGPNTSSSPSPVSSTSGPDVPRSESKRRCFFIYELICTALSEIPTLGEAIDILQQCKTALQLMFCAGWLHGDVSPGNILAFRSNPDTPWQVKLSDLEFSKKFPITGAAADEVIMGTPHFMSCELQTSRYLYLVDWMKSRQGAYPNVKVVPNFQHDVESIFWIILWLVTMRAIDCPSRVFGQRWFDFDSHLERTEIRFQLLSMGSSLWHYPMFEDSLPAPLHEQDCPFMDHLEDMRRVLRIHYVTRNGERRQGDIETYSWIMGEGISTFFNSVEDSREQWGDIELYVDLTQCAPRREETVLLPALSPSMKRRLEDSKVPSSSLGGGGDADRPRKRVRLAPSPDVQPPRQRAGPVTRSITRSQARAGPMTRSATRRLQQSTTKGVAAMPTRSSTRKTPR